MRESAARLVEALGLEPHPEGGWYRETHRAPAATATAGGRAASTAIYFLLTERSPSTMHRVDADEVFHHYAGDPVEQLVVDAERRTADRRWLGVDWSAGHRPQAVVPAGSWQGCRVASTVRVAGTEGEGWALLGCTVAPGFEFDGFALADDHTMAALRAVVGPDHADLLDALRP